MPRKPATVEVRDLAGVADIQRIAKAAGIPNVERRRLAYWRKRMAFPKPIRTIGKRTEVWDASHVRAWLHVRQLNREEGVTAKIVAPGIFEATVDGRELGRYRVDQKFRPRRVR